VLDPGAGERVVATVWVRQRIQQRRVMTAAEAALLSSRPR
jgi:hypothetical protein